MAVYLFPAASQAKLPIEAPDSDYNSNPKRLRAFIRNASMVLLESYENGVKYLCEIGMQWYSPSTQEWLKPTAILKQIQLPDFWEAERQYLESPGCLAKRCLIELQTLSGNGQLHYASPVSAIQIVPQASRPGQITEDNPIAFLDISNRRPCRTRVAGPGNSSPVPRFSSEESKTNSEPQVPQSLSAPVMESITSMSNMPPYSTTMNQISLRQSNRNTINDNLQGAGTADAPL
ncbi:hypothetical protein PABG_01924 [Paracoccidioides brasiliensis Pb03]|nr:hypothetical protein PABG_01924 [Paracoccidioides brasiliensis Pb03]